MSLELFKRDGFDVLPALLSPRECEALLADIVESFGDGPPSYVHEPRLRRHQPLRLTETVQQALTSVVIAGESLFRSFLGDTTALAELSSVSVFPGAVAQRLHADEDVPGKKFITAFINLVATHADNGALIVMPGSHAGTAVDLEVLALPKGSVIFMNGKLRHRGGANTTAEMRPVFYASFGDLDIRGPAYSIRPELKGQHRLEDFLRR